MKKKIVNADDTDVLNPMATTRNYAAGAEDGMEAGLDDDMTGDDDDDVDLTEDEPFPEELAFPEEEDDEDEMA